MNPDGIIGSLLALALGDAFGAPYEGGILERSVWAIIGKRNGRHRWTDDTQMSIDLAKSLIACSGIDQNDIARRFARSYRWSRGYGPGTAKMLKRIARGQSWETANRAVYSDGSYGNGAAMRSPVVGLYYSARTEDEIVDAAREAARVTHAHPLGIEGAALVALATALALCNKAPEEIVTALGNRADSPAFRGRLLVASKWLDLSDLPPPKTVAAQLGNTIAATESCVTAIYAALAFRKRSFVDLLGFVIQVGGDVDTIAAMACAIWGAIRGCRSLPLAYLERLEQRSYIQSLGESLAESANA